MGEAKNIYFTCLNRSLSKDTNQPAFLRLWRRYSKMKIAIRDAIQRGDLLRLFELLDDQDIDLDVRDIEGDTALSFATFCDNPEMVELLLARGAKPDGECEEYYEGFAISSTPLHIVCGRKGRFNLEIAHLLIRYGASINAADTITGPPLHTAVSSGYLDMVAFLLCQGADPLEFRTSAMSLAIKRYAKDDGAAFGIMWRWMVEQEKTTFPVDNEGNTALHVAAKLGLVGALDTMLKECHCGTGLSTSALNFDLKTPLAVAISSQKLDAARFILLFGDQPVVPLSFVAHPDLSKSWFLIQPDLASPLLAAFKMMLLGEKPRRFYNFERYLRQAQYDQLCQLIVDSGHHLGTERWLNYDFSDVLRGPEGPIEFRDVTSENIPNHRLDAARSVFETLKRQRSSPLTLKSLTRLAIRRSVMKNPCLGCKLDAFGKTSLEGLTESLSLPPKLRHFVTRMDI